LMGVGIPVLFLIAAIITINILQAKLPHSLPTILQTWDFLPKWMRSLQPYDSAIHLLSCADIDCCKSKEFKHSSEDEKV
jgi:solute carrier family 34 (sodium-dependent phosphate cotransporter)